MHPLFLCYGIWIMLPDELLQKGKHLRKYHTLCKLLGQ